MVRFEVVTTPDKPVFQRAVLGLNGGPLDSAVVRLACGLAQTGRSELVGVHVIEADWSHELTDDLVGDSAVPQQILDAAEAIAERARVPMTTVLLQARNVGAAIADEAAQREADLIVLGLPYRRRFGGDFDEGKVIPYVLANARSRVWVVREAQPAEDAA